MKTQNSPRSLYARFLTVIGLMLMAAATVRADYNTTVLGDNPVAFYALNPGLDGPSVCPDLTANGNNGAAFNITTNAAGPSPYITNAASFDGATAAVDLSMGGNPGLLNFGGPITMEIWVQSTNTTQGPADIIGKGYDSSQNDAELVLRANSGVNYFGGTYNNTNNGAGVSGGQQTTNWTYLVSTYDGTNWNLYVNTILVGQTADTIGAINFSDPLRIGTGSADGTSRYFNGNISEVAIYTNALTPAQVLTHYYMAELNSSPGSSAPIIITQPQPQSAFVGGTVTFSVGVVSALPTTNQWFANNVAMPGKTNSTLTLNNVGGATATTNYSVVVGNSNGKTNSVSVKVTLLATGNSLKWNSAGTSGVWDTNTTFDWINTANSVQTNFSANDQVLFDDTVGVSNNVTVNGTVSPSVWTVNSSVNNFTFNQGTSAQIGGVGSIIKQGSSLLTIYVQGFSGPVSITGGTIYAGNNCFNQVSSITITNNSTWDIGGATVPGNKPITVSGTGVGGKGAIFDSYGGSSESLNITLAGDTTFGSSARWDLAAGSQITGAHNLTIDWSPDTSNPYGEWTSLNIGANLAGITLTNGSKLGSHNMDTAFQNPSTVITVQTNSQIIFWNGGWNGTIHLLNGGQSFQFGAPGAFNGSTVVMENGAQWNTYGGGGDQSINVAITLNGIAHFVIGDNNRTYTNLISGAGGFVSDVYNHTMTFSASNTYSGPTIIGSSGNTPVVALANNGSISHSSLIFFGGINSTVVHMDVSGRPDQTLTLANGQTLGGIGTINGSLVVAAGATLSPAGTNTTIGITTGANATGTIAATSAVTLNGTTILKLNGSGVNDEIQAGSGITYGGTLILTNISGTPLAAGNSFQIASAAGYSGSFASITPATPGPGLAWDLSQLNTSGFVNVVSQPVINSVRVSSGNLIFSGTNGTASHSYSVLTTSNLATPFTNWTTLSTSAFDGAGAFSVTNAISPTVTNQFYIIKQ